MAVPGGFPAREIDDLLPLTDAAVMLTLARIDGSDIEITADGKEFAAADILTSKQLLAQRGAQPGQHGHRLGPVRRALRLRQR